MKRVTTEYLVDNIDNEADELWGEDWPTRRDRLYASSVRMTMLDRVAAAAREAWTTGDTSALTEPLLALGQHEAADLLTASRMPGNRYDDAGEPAGGE